MPEEIGLVDLGCWQHCPSYHHTAMKVTVLPSGKSLARVAIEELSAKCTSVRSRGGANSAHTMGKACDWRRY